MTAGRLVVVALTLMLWGLGTALPVAAPAEQVVVGDQPPHAGSAVAPLLKDLDDPDPARRIAAALALRELGPLAWPAVPPLIEALGDPHMGVRKSAAGALGGIGPDAAAAVPALEETLGDPHRFVRSWAAMALYEVGPPARPAAPRLAQLLAGDVENLRGRSWAASALPAVEADADLAVPALSAALRDDPSEEVRAVAVLSLERYGPRAAERGATLSLMEAMRDPHWKVRGNAACALPKLGRDAATPGLARLAAALSDTAPYVRGCAARSLGELGPRAAEYIRDLEALLRDDDTHVQRRAREALERIASG